MHPRAASTTALPRAGLQPDPHADRSRRDGAGQGADRSCSRAAGQAAGPVLSERRHIAEVEIDPETGVTTVARYTVTDDFGTLINPMLAEGQVHGGIAQGFGQAMTERGVYDSQGQLLTASFMDYAMPRADDLPLFRFTTEPVPSTANPLGMKGCGEAGTVGALAALANAVADALASGACATWTCPSPRPASGRCCMTGQGCALIDRLHAGCGARFARTEPTPRRAGPGARSIMSSSSTAPCRRCSRGTRQMPGSRSGCCAKAGGGAPVGLL